tara:strand:+ start:876 stop:1454 length:579 start_codon:yes stop_codon:yes gene_type:complete
MEYLYSFLNIHNDNSSNKETNTYINSIEELEQKNVIKYNIMETYFGGTLNHYFEVEYICGDNITNKTVLYTAYNQYNIVLLFPIYGLRIICTQKFIDNIPLVTNMLSGEYSDVVYCDSYWSDIESKIVLGSKYLILTSELESILYKNNFININRRITLDGTSEIRREETSSLYESIKYTNTITNESYLLASR